MSSLESRSIDSPDQGSISEAVISKIADLEDVNPIELPPLYQRIDPDALNQLVTSFATGPNCTMGEIAFSYYGYKVSIQADGSIEVISESR